jgi:hypothetical protein
MTIKSPTSCRAFSYWVFRYNSCRTSRPDVALIIIVLCVGTSCSLCPHHMKNPHTDIDAMLPNSCQPELTKLLKTYPKVYPQKLRIISEVQVLSYQGKSQNRLLFKQFYWQELSKPLIKKPTCFKIDFLLIFYS